MKAAWIPLLLALISVAGLSAQVPAQPPPGRPAFRAEVSLVEVSAVVTGDGARPVADLTKDDFEVLEDGVRRPIVSARFLSATPTRPAPVLPQSLTGARLDEVVTNRDLADAPAFVLLLDDLNVSAYDSHRAIRAGLGVLGAIPNGAFVSVVNTSGEGGALITLGRPNQTHIERVKAFRGQYLTPNPAFGGRGGSTMMLNTDDMVGVPLSQITRETGGRWIQNANNVEKLAAEVVTQNLSAYILAYESAVANVAGPHKIDVRVKRRGARVSARRSFVVAAGDRPPSSSRPSSDAITERLREVIQGGVPFGTLALQAHVAPQFTAAGPGRALVTVRVDDDTATDAATIDLLVLAADDTGKVASVERFAMSRPSTDVPWEGSITLTLERGPHQLRIAAATPDGARTGLLLHAIDMRSPSGDLSLGVPTLLSEDASGVRPTVARMFAVGHPLAFQVEVAGDIVKAGGATVHGRLIDAGGITVREQEATLEPAGSPAHRRATGLLATEGLSPGAYTMVVEARRSTGKSPVTHAIPVTVAPAAAGSPAVLSAARTMTPLPVAHGPFTRHELRGPQVIRTEREWKAFWLALATRQPAPDIDFARVTLLAIVAEDGSPASPQIRRVVTEPGGPLVEWTMAPTTAATAPDAVRPFVVMGLTQAEGRVRFARVPPDEDGGPRNKE